MHSGGDEHSLSSSLAVAGAKLDKDKAGIS